VRRAQASGEVVGSRFHQPSLSYYEIIPGYPIIFLFQPPRPLKPRSCGGEISNFNIVNANAGHGEVAIRIELFGANGEDSRQFATGDLMTVRISGDEVWLNTKKIRLRRRLPSKKRRLRPVGLKALSILFNERWPSRHSVNPKMSIRRQWLQRCAAAGPPAPWPASAFMITRPRAEIQARESAAAPMTCRVGGGALRHAWILRLRAG